MKWIASVIMAIMLTPFSISSAGADLKARGPLVQMTSNLERTCVVLEDGSAKCSEAELSDGPPVFRNYYAKIELNFAVKQIVPAYSFTCAISMGGDIYCWDRFSPSSSSKPNLHPAPVRLPLNERAQELSVHESYYGIQVCALTEEQVIFCWEIDPQKHKFPSFVPSPKAVVGLENVVDIDGKCAVESSGLVVCWEANTAFSTTARGSHLWVINELNDAQTISITTDHGCAITKTNTLKCWGHRALIGISQDAYASPGEISLPLELPKLRQVIKVTTRPQSTCALLENLKLFCWGYPFFISVSGSRQIPSEPTEIFTDEPVEDLGVSSSNNGGPYMIATKWKMFVSDPKNQEDTFYPWIGKLDVGALYSSSLISGIQLSSPLRVGIKSSAEFTPANGVSSLEISRTFEKVCQWLRDGKVVAAKASYFTPKPTDAGHKYSVSCTSKNGLFFDQTFNTPTSIVKLGIQTAAATPFPTIRGTTKAGQTLTAKAGTWSAGVALSYQWLRNGVAIKGATKSTYKLVAADKAKKISVQVIGRKAGYVRVVKNSVAKAISK